MSLASIRKREAAATKGPWRDEPEGHARVGMVRIVPRPAKRRKGAHL